MVDLIDECGHDLENCGYETVKLSKFGVTSSKLCVDTSSKARELGFDKGYYFILNAPLLSGLMPEHREMLKKEVTIRLDFLFKTHKVKKKDRILFVGIGNPQIIADSFGVRTVEKIAIEPYKKNNRIFKIMPNTFSNTGINAFDMIRLVVECFEISLVIIVDSLATQNVLRLGTSIQFNDAGLTPGSAMNNFGLAINQKTIKVPCFSIGVPMMISSRTLGVDRDIIFTEKDASEKVEFLSGLIAESLNELIV